MRMEKSLHTRMNAMKIQAHPVSDIRPKPFHARRLVVDVDAGPNAGIFQHVRQFVGDEGSK
jgi:hypothetical protein